MGTKEKKQYLVLDKIPILARTIIAFSDCRSVHQIILVIPEDDYGHCKEIILQSVNTSKPIHLVNGGKERPDSVYNGVKKAQSLVNEKSESLVLVHDGVRPFVDQVIIQNCIDKANQTGACIPGIPITDTIKQINPDCSINQTMDRETLFRAQTPQVFELKLLLKAFRYARETHFMGTDDASYIEHMGHPVFITEGSPLNIKITTPDDLIIAEQILRKGPDFKY